MEKIILLIAAVSFLFNQPKSTSPPAGPGEKVSLTIVYNNVPSDTRLTTAWGFSCFIEGTEKTILFDTGGDGSILLSNMKKLKLNPKNVDAVILSHIHGDHVGGLWSLLQKNNKTIVYLPESFPNSFKQRAEKMCKGVISVSQPIEICKNVWSTGELGRWMREQSLVINTRVGLVIVTGCAHPGIVNITREAKKLLKKEIYLVTGGFHLIGYSKKEITEIIRELKGLGVKKIAPSHCSGALAIELFSQAWGKDFVNLGCGAKIKIPDTKFFP